MFEVWPILTRVWTLASVPSGRTKEAARAFGFFSIRMATMLTLGRLEATPTGTTAPFSAISGPVT